MFLAILVFIPEQRLEISSAVENAFDKDGLVSDDERDGDPPLESCHAQSGQQITAPRSAQRDVESPLQNATMRPT